MTGDLSVDAAVARLVELAGSGARVIVGLVGEPGAGKSTVAAALVAGLADRAITAALVPMDGFHLANAELVRLGLRDRKGALETFDGAGYVALLRRLREQSGETVYAPTYTRGLEESVAGAIPVGPEVAVVVTEGNYLLVDEGAWSSVRGLLDETWAVVTDQSVRRERLAARHVQFGKSPEAAAVWVDTVDEPNAVRIRATLKRADRTVVTG
ncbi:MAG TPA: nucleoside/nucleotide kinase family protein [Propionibacteriaceae bacterium]|nr:nucleoside/nucleotide kinase family protein [Propionibacteriaceae bacterium]HQE31350.1 nucleoside/nucleotide kinase family protein [Propionibacteriaceae bacterium]